MRSIRLVVLVGVFGTVALPSAEAQQPPNGKEWTVDRWDQLRRSAPAVKYVVRWEMFPTDPKPGAPKPGEDGAYTGTGVVLLDPANRRLRVDQDELLHFSNRRERLSRMRITHRYDGREQSIALVTDFDATTAPAEAAFRNVDIGPWGSTMHLPDHFNPLLWGHGLIWTWRDTTSGAFPLDWRVRPDQFRPSGREEVGGKHCIVLRNTAAPVDQTETLWVDEQRGVIVRWRSEKPNGSSDEIGIEYQETRHGWLPLTWEKTESRSGRPPALSRRFRVESVTFDPVIGADDFRIALRPGMGVRQDGDEFRVREDGRLESVSAEGRRLDSVIGRAIATVTWPGLIGLVVVAVLVVALTRLRRREPVDSSQDLS